MGLPAEETLTKGFAMGRLKLIPWACGVLLVVASLIGANQLVNPDGTTPTGAGAPHKPAELPPPAPRDGLVVSGTVDSEPGYFAYRLPAHLPSGTVLKVPVRDGQEVAAGTVLLKFDDALLQKEYEEAVNALNATITQHKIAVAEQGRHETLVKKAKAGVETAVIMRNRAKEAVDLALRVFDKTQKLTNNLETSPITDAERQRRRNDEPTILEATTKLDLAEANLKDKSFDVELLEAQPVLDQVSAALYQAKVYEAKVEKAKLAISRCEVKAESAGTVERLAAAPGMVVYPQSQAPLLWFIPNGTRIVRAEVVPDFGYKIKDKLQQKVIISDFSSPHLTYEGTVRQVGSAFLPKANNFDLLNGKQSVVLEVVIEVIDPSPIGKPPLRVGQPVRITFS